MRSAEDWIRILELERHPEGGWYREVYRSADTIPASALPTRYGSARPAATSILFLLAPGEFSAFHRLRCDEVWLHHAGGGLILHRLAPGGQLLREKLGPDPDLGQELQRIVPAGTWFAATLADPGAYSLAGCVTAPGFEFDDFELGGREDLLETYPDHREAILRLTREKP